MVEITRATREKSKLRIALAGVSGGGKTLGALLLASGLTGGDFSKVCLIDTEHRRGELYANRSDLGIGEFWYIELKAPYSPDRYKECVDAAVQKVGPNGVVIVDSLSHAWNSSGGVLEIKAGIAAQPNKNSYTAWDEAGRIQNNFINYLLSVNCHTICTLRVKQDYVLTENDRGKQVPVKVGLAPVQRDDVEYEFDIMFTIGRDHMSELNYASALAALDDDFASASAQTGSGNLPIGRYNAILKEAKIVARSNNGIALSVSFVVTEGQYRGRYAFTSYGLNKNGLPFFKGFLQMIQLPLARLSELEKSLSLFPGHLCVINVQQDKQKPQYTRTYVDRYLGMGNVEDYLNPQTQPNAQEGFTVINDADDLPF